MKSISAAKFKEQCLSILDNLDSEDIVITKHGKAIAKLIAIAATDSSLIGSLSGKIEIKSEDFWDHKS